MVQLEPRSTRGKRMHEAIAEEEEQADAQFWNQEFFAEEQADDDYATEEEEEDVVDSDFDHSEEVEEDEAEDEETKRPRKKGMKPPGGPPKPKVKPKPKQPAAAPAAATDAAAGGAGGDVEGTPAPPQDHEPGSQELAGEAAPAEISYAAPTLRRSTMARSAEAEKERQRVEKATRRRPPSASQSVWKPLTQQELLAEAARTEVENIQSLKVLLAMEEETKRRAMVVKSKYTGPLVKMHSVKGPDGEEQTTLELCNTYYPPPWMEEQAAPPHPDRPTCVITGLPARYLDPRTGCPYASALAFRRLRSGAGPLQPAAVQRLLAATAHHRDQHQPGWQQQQRPQHPAHAAPRAPRPAGAPHPHPHPPVPARGLGVSASKLLADDGMPGPYIPKGRRSKRYRAPSRRAALIGAQLMAPMAPRPGPSGGSAAAGARAACAARAGGEVSPDVMALLLGLHQSLAS